METLALGPEIFEEIPSVTAQAGVAFWAPANPRRITPDMEATAELLYTSKGLVYFDSLVSFMEEIEHA